MVMAVTASVVEAATTSLAASVATLVPMDSTTCAAVGGVATTKLHVCVAVTLVAVFRAVRDREWVPRDRPVTGRETLVVVTVASVVRGVPSRLRLTRENGALTLALIVVEVVKIVTVG